MAAGSPLDVADLRPRVQRALDAFLDRQDRVLQEIGDELELLLGAVRDLVAGGKRFRAAFCYWGWRGAGGADGEEIVTAAAALELLQACALVHDDLMDRSDTRRGRPAAHRRFAAHHEAAGWVGSAEAFGQGAAILLGDLCLSWADEMVFTSGLPAEALVRAKPAYDVMRTELMAGQYLDLVEQARGAGSTAGARRVIRFKSAKYTVERPLHLGAALAGGPADLAAGYSAYGLALGEAFQLRDDVLGVFGDPAQTGKPAGDDLREGKRTVLLAATLDRASPAQAAVVRRDLGDRDLDPARLARLREVMVDSGAVDHVEGLIARLTGQAVAALASAPVEPSARAVLTDLAAAATAREH